MRQKLRKTLLFISFIFFRITMFFLSPVIIVWSASESVINGSFIIFLSLFLISLFLGRLFCGWICPTGGLNEFLFYINDSNCKRGKATIIKYLIFILWILTIIIVAISVGGYKKIDFFYRTSSNLDPNGIVLLIVYLLIVIIVLVLSLTLGKRAGCHYVCPIAPFMIIGRKIRNIFKWPSLKLVVEKSECVNCKACDKICPMSLEVSQMVQKNIIESTDCILCGECIDKCSKKVIKFQVK
jgi:ferredoxin-type protein NapH